MFNPTANRNVDLCPVFSADSNIKIDEENRPICASESGRRVND